MDSKEELPEKEEARKKRQLEKAEAYNGFFSKSNITQNKLSCEIYNKALHTILIGGMASGSKPNSLKLDPNIKPELQRVIDSLLKKSRKNFLYKSEYRKDPLLNTNLSWRATYDGANNVARGYKYSTIRLDKYLTGDMKIALIQEIKLIMSVDTNKDISNNELVQIAQKKLIEQLKRFKENKGVLVKCVLGLTNALLKAPPESYAMDTDKNLLLQLIVITEVTAIFDNTKNSLSRDNYMKIMALLSMAIINKLSVEKIQPEEKFYENMTSLKEKTLVGNSGTMALLRALSSIGISAGKFSGFPLESAIPGPPTRGYFMWCNDQYLETDTNSVKKDLVCALIGRTTETKYNLDVNSDAFESTLKEIEEWIKNQVTTPPKLLIVDITIPTPEDKDPILQKVLDLRKRLGINSFDILLVRSEQKQHSLGVGKFAAGSSFLITDNEKRRLAFNEEAQKPRTIDEKLATFYRENVAQEVIDLTLAQAESAQKFVEQNQIAEAKDIKIVANGPFVLIENDDKKIYGTDLPSGYSFGFITPSFTSFQKGQMRIDVGVQNEQEEKGL